MKLKSLILGSVAAAGLSTAGFAADLGVLTSLDVCDELGLSGLTISSDTNCLQISGEVRYEFEFGNWDESVTIAAPGNIGFVTSDGDTGLNNGLLQDVVSVDSPSDVPGSDSDWQSRLRTWLQVVGTASSDFGPASAVIKLKHDDRVRVRNGGTLEGGYGADPVQQRESAGVVVIDEAYVQVGDSTVLTAGKRGSIFNKGDDEPFNFTGLFISEVADAGIIADENAEQITPRRGGHVIQLWTNVGEGLIAKVGLENLNANDDWDGARGQLTELQNAQKAGTLVGVLDYAGSGITAHLSAAYGGILDGETNDGDTYLVHTGATASFDNFRVRGALAVGGGYNEVRDDWYTYWNGLVTGEATFDLFKVALSGEFLGGDDPITGDDIETDFGLGASVGFTVAEGIEINLGGRYFNDGTDGVGDGYQVAAQLVAAVTETIKATGEIGIYGHGDDTDVPGLDGDGDPILVSNDGYSDFYAKASLGWTPGGGFSSNVGATVQENGAYKVTFDARKAFQ